MYAMLLPHQKKGSQLTPQSVMPLSWDKTEDAREVNVGTPDEIESVKQRFAERDAKQNREIEQSG